MCQRGIVKLNIDVEVVDARLETKNFGVLEWRIVMAHWLGELVDAYTFEST